MNLHALFKKCLNTVYTHVENDASYAVEVKNHTLNLFFEWSNGKTDWLNNLDFPAKPYKHMGTRMWFAHRGFLRVWKSIEPYVQSYIKDPKIKRIVICGYSHGAAIAMLCHEYCWYNRPDLVGAIEGYGFGCPRVYWGVRTKKMKSRWNGFHVIRNLNDIVTHVPPALFGYKHMGEMIEVGEHGKYSPIDAHRWQNIDEELKKYEDEKIH